MLVIYASADFNNVTLLHTFGAKASGNVEISFGVFFLCKYDALENSRLWLCCHLQFTMLYCITEYCIW